MKILILSFLFMIFLSGCFSGEEQYVPAMGEMITGYGDNQDDYLYATLEYINDRYDDEFGIRGFLTQLVYNGNTAYIFGSMHVGSLDWFPLHPDVYRAMDISNYFLFEYDLTTDEAVISSLTLQHITNNQHNLSNLIVLLSEDQQADFEENIADWLTMARRVDFLPIPSLFLNRYLINSVTPFALYTIASLLAFESIGISQTNSVDMYILEQAKNRQVSIGGLISIEEEIGLMMNLSTEVEVWLLSNFPTSEQMIAQAEQITLIYQQQNVEEIARLLYVENIADENPLEQWINDVVMIKRSQKFAEEIASLMRQDTENTFFIVVGVGHMIGNDESNIFNLLRIKGIETQKEI